jgi:hypothetical protein
VRLRFWQQAPDAEQVAPAPEAQSGAGKGRPTPTRKEAEAARKQNLKVPSDPKEARKAAKARAAAERNESRAALLAGDEKALSGRDAGPVKAHIRNFIDGRWCAAELFLPIAVVVLIFGFLRLPQVQQIVTFLWLASMLFIVMDTTLVLRRLDKDLKERWPAKEDRKGAMFYAGMRAVQIRKLRLPPPKFRPGGKPVVPKEKK